MSLSGIPPGKNISGGGIKESILDILRTSGENNRSEDGRINNKATTPEYRTDTSIVDYLKSQGQDSSYQSRSQMAGDAGIENYRGTADQNIQLLNQLKQQGQTTPGTGAGAGGGDPYGQEQQAETEERAWGSEYGMGDWAGMEEGEPMIEGLRKEINQAQQRRDETMKEIENRQVELFNEEYQNRDLDQTKGQIKEIDSELDNLRNQREEAILTARRNPNISAGVLSGEVQKINDYYNSVINNQIEQRNAIAQQYNNELEEIDAMTQRQLGDLENQYNHYNSIIDQATRHMNRYEDLLREEMQRERQEQQWEQEMALQLQSLEEGERDRLQAITDPYTGEVTGFYNPYTREVMDPKEDGASEDSRLSVTDDVRNSVRTPSPGGMTYRLGDAPEEPGFWSWLPWVD